MTEVKKSTLFKEWAQVGSLVLTIIGATAFLWSQISTQSDRIDQLHKDLIAQSQVQTARTDQLQDQFTVAMAAQTLRTDKLYEMFYEVVRENRK